MKIFAGILLAAVLFSGCTGNKTVEYNSKPFQVGKEKLGSMATFDRYVKKDAIDSEKVVARFRELSDSLNAFHIRKTEKILESCVELWKQSKPHSGELSGERLKSWVAETADLMAATGETRYARELERILDTTENDRLKQSLLKIVTPYILTKDVDHIYVNLFYNSTVQYTHSLGGAVKIEQVVDPEKKTVDIYFSMEERRYIELYIRIPEWVEKADVEVKKVYYLPVPGEYCKIAKKWKEGDVANVRFHF